MFMEITTQDDIKGIDPFEQSITIASVCNLVYRTLYLKSEQIGIIPPHGYRPEQKQSIKALYWLNCISKIHDVNIQHAFNGGEKQIGPFKVDGYRETASGEKIVYEFNGCPKCFSRNTVNPVNDTTMSDLHMKTLDKMKFLQDKGYTYESIWECQYDHECKVNDDLKCLFCLPK